MKGLLRLAARNNQSNSLEELFASRVASLKRVFVLFSCLLGFSIGVAIQTFQFQLVINRLDLWLQENLLAIEENLFIGNSFSLQGNIEALNAQSSTSSRITFAIIDRSGHVVLGEEALVVKVDQNSKKNYFQFLIGDHTVVRELRVANQFLGYLVVAGKLTYSAALLSVFIGLSLAVLIFFILNHLAIRSLLSFKGLLIAPLLELQATMANLNNASEITIKNPLSKERAPEELWHLGEVYSTLINRINASSRAELELSRSKAIYSLATQVAHDIRSPLSALSIVSLRARSFPDEDLRNLLNTAIARVSEIVGDLSNLQHVEISGPASSVDNSLMSIPILALVTDLVEEIRARSKETPELDINVELVEGPFSVCALIHPPTFKRALSNILNNAVEAMADVKIKSIHIECKSDDRTTHISIADTGPGIPKDLIGHIGKKGFSFGKSNGSGLGLSYAQEVLKACGGSLLIESSLGNGTRVCLSIPRSNGPAWLLEKIDVVQKPTICVVDDDDSVHAFWQTKLGGSTILNAKSSAELAAILPALQHKQVMFLVDYQLRNERISGLDLVRSFNLGSSVVLVTTYYQDLVIQSRVGEFGIKILPKQLFPWI